MSKGFTLIELLVVIGIIAILSTLIMVVVNPAQLLAQARDSQRLSDLAAVRNAISTYTASVSSPELDGTGAQNCTTMCFSHSTSAALAVNCGGRHTGKTTTQTTSAFDK